MRALLATLSLAACADLPAITASTCGNAVIEDGETCDTFAPYPGAVCRAPNTVGACLLDCRRQADGTRATCREGWACDSDDLCRAPSGSFALPTSPVRVGGASKLSAGDFDGDGRGEVVSRSLPNDLGEAVFQLHHFDVSGRLDDTRGFGRRVGALTLADLTNDGRDDILFPLFGVGLVPGQADRSLVPETFSPNAIEGSRVRMVSLVRGQVEQQSGAVYLTAVDGTPGLYVIGLNLRLSLRGPMHGSVDMLAGDPTSASVVEDTPCRELIHGFRGQSLLYVSDLCERDPNSGTLRWRNAEQTTVSLEPPAPLNSSPLPVDLNADGHTDLLIGTELGPYVAFGDGQALQTAVPFRLAGVDALEMPLAAGELTGDGAPDFVLPRGLLLSSTPASAQPRYDLLYRNPGAPWTQAQLDDLNGNGALDVIAASQRGSGVDFFSGTRSPVLIATTLPTAGPVSRLASGDFDGDTLHDLAFVEQRPSSQLPDLVNIAYGRAFEPPRSPIIAARIPSVQDLTPHPGIGLLTHLWLGSLQTTPRTLGLTTWLFGSPDRLPISVVDLVTFANDGSLMNSRALALAAGAFASVERRDVIGFAVDPRSQAASFWLLPGLATTREPLRRIPGAFDPRMQPIETRADGSSRTQIVSLAAQLDADPRDETVWVMPADQGQRCGVAIAGLQLEPTQLLVTRQTLFLDVRCQDAQLASLDVDGDGRRDLLVLASHAEGSTLQILWNEDGFASERATRIEGIAPTAFAALPTTPEHTFQLALVTTEGLYTVTATAPRAFGVAERVAPLRQGTGIAASDVTGDGLLDLVVADAGDLSVFRAEWKR